MSRTLELARSFADAAEAYERGRPGWPEEALAHLVTGLDCHDLGEPLHERPRQLAGAGGEIDDASSGTELERGRGPAQRLGRVLRPRVVVLGRDPPEASREPAIQHRQPRRRLGGAA